ncbi:Type I restriction-modification system, restriction subunit R [Methanosarcina mazei Tuc01]|uniref:Type I restriction-modification system, restriction subunit R n=1 Tax=Methanosarcina mazei Tuc01 TaxID=1236903 RepID=M1QCV5_METMZ|nr:hypothetical protein [Methanosarcina mazei]AGF98078.1 Type I restriction-modification system, restriction subunit R [Methanosarcina mazei Tuc01]
MISLKEIDFNALADRFDKFETLIEMYNSGSANVDHLFLTGEKSSRQLPQLKKKFAEDNHSIFEATA